MGTDTWLLIWGSCHHTGASLILSVETEARGGEVHAGHTVARHRWPGTARGNSGRLTVRQPGGEILHQPVPRQEQLASGCGSCLERPKALPSAGSGPRKGSGGAHRPGTHLLVERARGGAGGGNNVPLATCTNSSTGCLQVHLCKRLPCPLPEHLCHLSLRQRHQDGEADAGGDQVQEGRLQEDTGCEAVPGRIPPQGHTPFPGHDSDSYCPGPEPVSVWA